MNCCFSCVLKVFVWFACGLVCCDVVWCVCVAVLVAARVLLV